MYFLKVSPFLLSLFLVGCGSESGDSSSSETITIFPKISNAVLVNPDIGFNDFHSISIHDDNGNGGSVQSYPETSTIYYRWNWSELVDETGAVDLTEITDTLKLAQTKNKKLMFRIMATETADCYRGIDCTSNIEHKYIDKSKLPESLKADLEKAGALTVEKVTVPNPDSTTEKPLDDIEIELSIPDYSSTEFIDAAKELLAAFPEELKDPNNITSIDIGFVGSWGEWHLEDVYPGVDSLGNFAEGEKGKQSVIKDFPALSEFAEMHKTAFPNIPRVMLIGSSNENETFLAQATGSSNPSGWRADCLGDKKGFYGPGESHMGEGYPAALDNAKNNGSPGIRSIWENAPVQFETCDDMTVWKEAHSFTIKDVTEVFDYALNHHASLINAKSKPIPDEFQPAVQEVLKKLGYRFELLSLTHQKEVAAGNLITINSEWKNSGVAPSYYPYRVAYRFVDPSGNVEKQQDTSREVLDWLPAETRERKPAIINIADDITVPTVPGAYDLQIGLVNDLGDAKIKLAIDMPQKDNWYSISTITVN